MWQLTTSVTVDEVELALIRTHVLLLQVSISLLKDMLPVDCFRRKAVTINLYNYTTCLWDFVLNLGTSCILSWSWVMLYKEKISWKSPPIPEKEWFLSKRNQEQVVRPIFSIWTKLVVCQFLMSPLTGSVKTQI